LKSIKLDDVYTEYMNAVSFSFVGILHLTIKTTRVCTDDIKAR